MPQIAQKIKGGLNCCYIDTKTTVHVSIFAFPQIMIGDVDSHHQAPKLSVGPQSISVRKNGKLCQNS